MGTSDKLQLILRVPYVAVKVNGIGPFEASVRVETSAALGLPVSAVQVQGIYSQGADNTIVDCALRGAATGLAAAAAQRLFEVLAISDRNDYSILAGAEVKVIPAALPENAPTLPQFRPAKRSWKGEPIDSPDSLKRILPPSPVATVGPPSETAAALSKLESTAAISADDVVKSAISQQDSELGYLSPQVKSKFDKTVPIPMQWLEKDKVPLNVRWILEDTERLVQDRPRFNGRLHLLEMAQKEREPIEQMERAVAVISKVFRGMMKWRARTKMKRLQKYNAQALKIQCQWRSYWMRKQFAGKKRRKKPDRAAMYIQAWWRGINVKFGVIKQLAARKIQNVFRGNQGRKKAQKKKNEREAMVLLQRSIRIRMFARRQARAARQRVRQKQLGAAEEADKMNKQQMGAMKGVDTQIKGLQHQMQKERAKMQSKVQSDIEFAMSQEQERNRKSAVCRMRWRVATWVILAVRWLLEGLEEIKERKEHAKETVGDAFGRFAGAGMAEALLERGSKADKERAQKMMAAGALISRWFVRAVKKLRHSRMLKAEEAYIKELKEVMEAGDAEEISRLIGLLHGTGAEERHLELLVEAKARREELDRLAEEAAAKELEQAQKAPTEVNILTSPLGGAQAGQSTFTRQPTPAVTGNQSRVQDCRFSMKGSSNAVRISTDGDSARRVQDDEGFGVVLSVDPLEKHNEGYYLEVKVDEAQSGEQDGLALGITTTSPDGLFSMEDLPMYGFQVPGSTCIGFTGISHSSDYPDDFVEVDWEPSLLKAGDTVGLLVKHDRHMYIYVNGHLKVRGPHQAPAGRDFYAIVDLVGNTRSVSLVEDFQMPDIPQAHVMPHGADHGHHSHQPASHHEPHPHGRDHGHTSKDLLTKTGHHDMHHEQHDHHDHHHGHMHSRASLLIRGGLTFSHECVSEHVRMSGEGRKAWHVHDEIPEGVLLSKDPVPIFDDGHYFEVEVLRVREGHEDGLAVGVTTTKPRDLFHLAGGPPAYAFQVPDSWCIGFVGMFHCSDMQDEFEHVEWHPHLLQVGDSVGCMVTRSGRLCVLVNHKPVAWSPEHYSDGNPVRSIPVRKDLYAVVDILGNTREVTFVPDAEPSRAASREAARLNAMHAPVDHHEEHHEEHHEHHHEEDHHAHRRHSHHDVHEPEEEGGSDMEHTLTFSNRCVSPQMGVSRNGLACWRKDPDSEHFGVLLCEDPVPKFTDGFYFEIEIDRVREGQEDGLGIGVTTTRPKDIRKHFNNDLPEFGIQVPDSWMIGFTGFAHHNYDGDLQDFDEVDWNPTDLHVGDRIGCLVTLEGKVMVIMNGAIAAEMPEVVIPEEVVHGHDFPLYAVVDIVGNTLGASIVPGAHPPQLGGGWFGWG